MRPGRVLLTIYLGVTITVFVAIGQFVSVQLSRPSGDDVGVMARHVLSDLVRLRGDPARLRAELDELAAARFHVSLYAPDRQLIASSVEPPLPITDHPPHRGFATQRIIENGAVVAIGSIELQRPDLRHVLSRVGILFVMLVLLVSIITRQLGIPLQRIATAARRFGRGDLQARARMTRNDELGEVGRAFDEMADRITTLMTAQRELMANVSHELQTPLARIQVAVDLMVDGIDDRAKELLPEISKDLGEVERLIDDVMTLSRFDLSAGAPIGLSLRREPTPIAELVDAAASRFRSLHPERALDVTLDPELPTLALDAMLVRRVLDNLLDNARKYSEPDTPLALAASITSSGVALSVADRGIGIDAADLAQLFTPFFRTDRSRTRSTGGVGLGLVLARRIVEAHGGDIAVRSAAGRGTTVEIHLPA